MKFLYPKTISVVHLPTVNLHHLSPSFPPSLPGIVALAHFAFFGVVYSLPPSLTSARTLDLPEHASEYWFEILWRRYCECLASAPLSVAKAGFEYYNTRHHHTSFKNNSSSAHDGRSGNGRGDSIQGITAESTEIHSIADPEAAPELPTQSPSLSKRQREIGRMVECGLINSSHLLFADEINHTSSLSLKVRASEAKQPRTDLAPEVAFKVG